MIFQFVVGPTGAIVQPVPFIGKCKVKIIRIDYVFDTAAAISQQVIQIQSQTLINNTALSGRILFYNTTNPYFGDNFIIDDVDINGYFDITLQVLGGAPLPFGAGGYTNCIITADITPQ